MLRAAFRMMDLTKLNRILIVKLSSMGDVVMATPAAKALRRAFPNAHIAWVVEDRFAQIVVGNPHIDDVIVWRVKNSGKADLPAFVRTARLVRSGLFDAVVDLQGNAKSALMVLSSGAPIRVGYANPRECAGIAYNVRVPCSEFPHQMRSHADVLRAVSPEARFEHGDMHVPLTDEDRRFADEFLDSVVGPGVSVAAFVCATTRPFKHWPARYWAELARVFQDRLGLTPVFVGAPADDAYIGSIMKMARCRTVSAVGRTTVLQAAAIVERCALTVGVDTGLLHIAVALRRPTIGIYGPTPQWGNHARAAWFRAMVGKRGCAPCVRRPVCAKEQGRPDCRNRTGACQSCGKVDECLCFPCMSAVSVEDVAAAASELLRELNPAAARVVES